MMLCAWCGDFVAGQRSHPSPRDPLQRGSVGPPELLSKGGGVSSAWRERSSRSLKNCKKEYGAPRRPPNELRLVPRSGPSRTRAPGTHIIRMGAGRSLGGGVRGAPLWQIWADLFLNGPGNLKHSFPFVCLSYRCGNPVFWRQNVQIKVPRAQTLQRAVYRPIMRSREPTLNTAHDTLGTPPEHRRVARRRTEQLKKTRPYPKGAGGCRGRRRPAQSGWEDDEKARVVNAFFLFARVFQRRPQSQATPKEHWNCTVTWCCTISRAGPAPAEASPSEPAPSRTCPGIHSPFDMPAVWHLLRVWCHSSAESPVHFPHGQLPTCSDRTASHRTLALYSARYLAQGRTMKKRAPKKNTRGGLPLHFCPLGFFGGMLCRASACARTACPPFVPRAARRWIPE
eukprot:gene24675-biopygen4433